MEPTIHVASLSELSDVTLPDIGSCEVWLIDKAVHSSQIQKYWAILSQEEKARADRFRFFKDKSCFVIARGILKNILAQYSGQSPEKITFSYGSYGKPYSDAYPQLYFNVSHSENCIAIGFIRDHEIGVDVEKVKTDIEALEVAQSFFSKKEIARLKTVAPEHVYQCFFNCWTRKEAFIKAEGSGLSFPLDQFSVSLEDSTTAQLLETQWDNKEHLNWVLLPFTPAQGYIGAIAIKGNVSQFFFKRYPPA